MTTTDNAPVPTAEDFLEEIVPHSDGSYGPEDLSPSWDKTAPKFEELISKIRTQAFSEGRKQGLKEMDEAWGDSCSERGIGAIYNSTVSRLYYEYSAK